MYELPGEDFHDPISVFWLSPEGVSGLIGSAYLRHQVDNWVGFAGENTALECGFPDEHGELIFGDELENRLSDVGVVGHASCTEDSLNAVEWSTGGLDRAEVGKWDREEVESGGYHNNVGYFPFQVNVPYDGTYRDFSNGFPRTAFPLDYQSIAGRAVVHDPDPHDDEEGTYVNSIYSRLIQGNVQGGSRASDESGEVVLVKAGVERPVDADGAIGTRKLNRFDFVIDEAEQFGSHSIVALDDEGRRRFGFPRSPGQVAPYTAQWPHQPISPNRPYLLVFTYYEQVHDGGVEFKVTDADEDNPYHDEKVKVPERHIRRVICRAIINPSGYGPVVPEGGWWGGAERAIGTAAGAANTYVLQPGLGALNKAGGVVGGAIDVGKGAVAAIGGAIGFLANPGEWISGLLLSFALIPKEGAERGVGLACDSAGVVDEYMEPDGASLEPATLVTADGVMVENQGVVARQSFNDDCLDEGASLAEGVGGTDGVVCAPSGAVGGESCADLPTFTLYLDGERHLQDGGGWADSPLNTNRSGLLRGVS